jgi:hypothetical protein
MSYRGDVATGVAKREETRCNHASHLWLQIKLSFTTHQILVTCHFKAYIHVCQNIWKILSLSGVSWGFLGVSASLFERFALWVISMDLQVFIVQRSGAGAM